VSRRALERVGVCSFQGTIARIVHILAFLFSLGAIAHCIEPLQFTFHKSFSFARISFGQRFCEATLWQLFSQLTDQTPKTSIHPRITNRVLREKTELWDNFLFIKLQNEQLSLFFQELIVIFLLLMFSLLTYVWTGCVRLLPTVLGISVRCFSPLALHPISPG
jgi:hypothetical protein